MRRLHLFGGIALQPSSVWILDTKAVDLIVIWLFSLDQHEVAVDRGGDVHAGHVAEILVVIDPEVELGDS